MKKLAVILASVSIVLLGVGTIAVLAQKPVTQPVLTPQVQSIPLNADTIFFLVNQERVKAGLQPLVKDERLVKSAQTKADDMNANNYFAHINPTTGVNGYTLIPNGICSYKSENISEMLDPSGDNNAETISGWMGSKPHHDAILDARYTLTGVAVSGDKVVQHFCIAK